MSTMKRHYKSRQHRLTLGYLSLPPASESPLETTATPVPGQRGSSHVCTIWFSPEKGRRKHVSICGIYLMSLCQISFLCSLTSVDLNRSPRYHHERRLFKAKAHLLEEKRVMRAKLWDPNFKPVYHHIDLGQRVLPTVRLKALVRHMCFYSI